MQFRKHFGYDTEKASNEAALQPDEHGESLTIQSHSEDADINVLMRRFKVTGQLPQIERLPSYGDFTGISDYRTALHAVMDAEDQFLKLPAELRAKYQNDPQLFLEAVDSGSASEALRAVGLLPKVEAAPPPPPAAPAAS